MNSFCGQMSIFFWRNLFWANVLLSKMAWANVCGQISLGQLSLNQISSAMHKVAECSARKEGPGINFGRKKAFVSEPSRPSLVH